MRDLGAVGWVRIFPRPLVWRLVSMVISRMVVSVISVIVIPRLTMISVLIIIIVEVSRSMMTAAPSIKVLSVPSMVLEPPAMMSASVIMMVGLEREHDGWGFGRLFAKVYEDCVFVGEPV